MVQPPLREGTGRTILLVDDERALLKILSVYLSRLGYQTRAAESTDQAWAAVRESAGELAAAVLDASLPGLSTEDLAANLLAANPRLCAVVASGYPVDMSVLEEQAPGRVLFLQKPFTPEMLAATLRRMIGAQEEKL